MLKLFLDLRADCNTLSDAEYTQATEYLTSTYSDHIDYSDEQGRAVYFYGSATHHCAQRLQITDPNKVAEIELLAYEYSLHKTEEF